MPALLFRTSDLFDFFTAFLPLQTVSEIRHLTEGGDILVHRTSVIGINMETIVPEEMRVASDRLDAANQKLEQHILKTIPRILKSHDKEMRKRAIDILLSWRTFDVTELLFQEVSKYDVPPTEVDCANGILSGCEVFCCKSFFVRITDEDIAEGVEQHPGLPYFIRVTSEGCYALDAPTGRCTIWEKRPLNCRIYSCKTDKRFPGCVAGPLHARSTRQL